MPAEAVVVEEREITREQRRWWAWRAGVGGGDRQKVHRTT